jgi:two-component system sensor histidine kinase KdpD
VHLVAPLRAPSHSADSTLVERTLRNLLENALKYAPSGKPVVLRLSDTPTRVELRVEDEGAVIAPEHRQKIFEPFFKLENSGRTGHGVGLAFCAKAVTLHGGTLEVEERAGGGNSFVVRLPRRPAT